MAKIDAMVALLRKEEAEDIAHKDLCENELNANKNSGDDLKIMIDKATKKLGRLGNTKKELEGEIKNIDDDIDGTEKDMADLLKMRNAEEAAFIKALKADTDAVALLKDAIKALSKFYKNNKISMSLAQKGPISGRPEYSEDPDVAPSTWEEPYGGRKSEGGGIVAILEMLVEDTEKEIADGRADDKTAQEEYLEQNGALTKTLDAQKVTKVGLEQELADCEAKIDTTDDYKKGLEADQQGNNGEAKALATDCDWVKTHFDTRRAARKTEISGLMDAKDFLAGVEF
jgi:uncharacterized protein YicC (UPF0701 family)